MEQTKKARTGLLLFSLALGTFMSALDANIVTIAMPVIKNHFGVSLGMVEWVTTAYLLVVSGVLLFFGRFSDLYGHKKVYLTGFAVFTAGSALCGLSVGMGMLIGCRVFQALGAAMMFACNGAIISDNFPAKNRGKAFSVIAIAVAAALCAGPVLGGAVAGMFGWQYIFFINIPIGIAGIILGARFIPADRQKSSVPQDIPGGVLAFAALFLILLPLDQLSEGMNVYLSVGLLVMGVALAAVFILYEKRAKYPMLNLSLFSNRVFSASILAAVFNYMAQFIMAFLAPFYLQDIMRYSPIMTGLLYMPMPLATLVAAPLAGIFADKLDTRYLSAGGMALMACGLIMLSFIDTHTAHLYIIISMVLCGLGSGLFQTPNNTAIMNNAPDNCRGVAASVLSIARNIGMVLGVAVSGALFTLISGKGVPDGVVAASEQGIFIHAFHITYIVAGVVALLAAFASLAKGKVQPAGEAKTQEV